MVNSRLHRRVNLATRVVSGLTAGVALVFFVANLIKIVDKMFWPEKPGISALPVAALSLSILWNIVVLIVLLVSDINRYVQIVGDTISFLVLAVLGSIGFAHDDKYYLSNGAHRYDGTDNWLVYAIVAGALGILVICLQLFLIIWGFLKSTRKVLPEFTGDQPPSYNNKRLEIEEQEKNVEIDWDSVSSMDMTQPHISWKEKA